MNGLKQQNGMRLVLMLAILLSGIAMTPFIDIPAEAINWELLAGVYEPSLDVNEDSGAPGSVFAFTGSDYPALSNATVYVNGDQVGNVMTDASGMAAFKLNTTGAAVGQYNVTLEVDINASATESIELKVGEQVVTPPPGFTGPAFSMQNRIYQPVVIAD